MCFVNCLIHISSLVVAASARYFASIDVQETMICFFAFHDIKASPMNMQKTGSDFWESMHDAQSASLKTFSGNVDDFLRKMPWLGCHVEGY